MTELEDADSLWNEHIQSEMIWHISLKNAISRDEYPEMWALAEGNSRGLKEAQKAFYNASNVSSAVNTLRDTLQNAVSEYRSGENIIESQDDDMAELFTEGYLQGLVRAWTITDNGLSETDDSDHYPPQDLSACRDKQLMR